jgi:hypothetical protein
MNSSTKIDMAQQKKTLNGKIIQDSVHVSLEKGLMKILKDVAESDKRPVSNMVRILILEALEARGDIK